MAPTRPFVILGILGAVAVAACAGSGEGGGTTPLTVEGLLPTDGQISGWTRSAPIRLLPAAKAGEGYAAGGVNGDAEKYIANGLVTLGIGKYQKSATQTLELRVWDMGTSAAAGRGWTDLTNNDPRYSGDNWGAASVGEVGRISDTGTYWWVVTRKGAFIAEVMHEPSDPGLQDAAVSFLKAVVARIP